MSKRVAIVGATLPGCVAGYHLSKLGYKVDMFDSLETLDNPIASSLEGKFPLEEHLFFIPLSSSYIQTFLDNAGLSHNATIAGIAPKDISIYRDGFRISSFYSVMSGKIYLTAYFVFHHFRYFITRKNRYQNKTISRYFEDCYGSKFSSTIALPLVEAIYGNTPSYLKIDRAFAHTQTTNRVQFLNIFRLSKSLLKTAKPLIHVAFYKGGESGLAQDILTAGGVNHHSNHTVTAVRLSEEIRRNTTAKPTYCVNTSQGLYDNYDSVIITTDAHTAGEILTGFRSNSYQPLTTALKRVPYADSSTLYLLYNTNEHLDFSVLLTPFYERGLIGSIMNLSRILGDNNPHTLLRININSHLNDGTNAWDNIIHEFYDKLNRKMVPLEVIQDNYRTCTLHTSVDYDHTDNLIQKLEDDNKGLILLGDYVVDYPHNAMMKTIMRKILKLHYT